MAVDSASGETIDPESYPPRIETVECGPRVGAALRVTAEASVDEDLCAPEAFDGLLPRITPAAALAVTALCAWAVRRSRARRVDANAVRSSAASG